MRGEAPPEAELGAYVDRLREIVAAGGKIHEVQIYTVARPPAESFVASLTNEEVDAIAEKVESKTGVTAERYYG